MKFFIALSLLVAAASAGTLSGNPFLERLPLPPVDEELEGRITNGQVAHAGQFPYTVGLSLVFGNQGAWCGGTLISDRWIVTAAHCTDKADGVTVYLGAINIKDENERGQQRVWVSKWDIIIHPNWNPSSLTGDLSVLKLPFAIGFNDRIQPAVLPKPEGGSYNQYENDKAWASGWGKDSDAATAVSPVLRYIESPVLKQSSCSTYYVGMINKDMICISGKDGRSTCNGDSGGPLVYKQNGRNVLIGATSFGISLGCEKGWPGVFTRISSYVNWIKEKTGVSNNW